MIIACWLSWWCLGAQAAQWLLTHLKRTRKQETHFGWQMKFFLHKMHGMAHHLCHKNCKQMSRVQAKFDICFTSLLLIPLNCAVFQIVHVFLHCGDKKHCWVLLFCCAVSCLPICIARVPLFSISSRFEPDQCKNPSLVVACRDTSKLVFTD